MRPGLFLPEGPGDEESPEELRALEVYDERMRAFELLLDVMGRKPRRRKRRHVYETRNCEEASGRQA